MHDSCSSFCERFDLVQIDDAEGDRERSAGLLELSPGDGRTAPVGHLENALDLRLSGAQKVVDLGAELLRQSNVAVGPLLVGVDAPFDASPEQVEEALLELDPDRGDPLGKDFARRRADRRRLTLVFLGLRHRGVRHKQVTWTITAHVDSCKH
jgi:hypothetical protein